VRGQRGLRPLLLLRSFPAAASLGLPPHPPPPAGLIRCRRLRSLGRAQAVHRRRWLALHESGAGSSSGARTRAATTPAKAKPTLTGRLACFLMVATSASMLPASFLDSFLGLSGSEGRALAAVCLAQAV
jgi:hypothetical protein